jgi:hypothetical protein
MHRTVHVVIYTTQNLLGKIIEKVKNFWARCKTVNNQSVILQRVIVLTLQLLFPKMTFLKIMHFLLLFMLLIITNCFTTVISTNFTKYLTKIHCWFQKCSTKPLSLYSSQKFGKLLQSLKPRFFTIVTASLILQHFIRPYLMIN